WTSGYLFPEETTYSEAGALAFHDIDTTSSTAATMPAGIAITHARDRFSLSMARSITPASPNSNRGRNCPPPVMRLPAKMAGRGDATRASGHVVATVIAGIVADLAAKMLERLCGKCPQANAQREHDLLRQPAFTLLLLLHFCLS